MQARRDEKQEMREREPQDEKKWREEWREGPARMERVREKERAHIDPDCAQERSRREQEEKRHTRLMEMCILLFAKK